MYDGPRLSRTRDMRPISFDGHFGYLHLAANQAKDTAILICPAVGRDARCAYRPLHDLAVQLAGAGYATLRYDPRGCGDSLDLAAPDADATEQWLAGVREAIDELKSATGISKVILLGVRFGATLAALSASLADGLILLGPVLRGKTWLRELKLATKVLAPTSIETALPDGLDTDGLFLSTKTVLALEKLDLGASSPFPCPTLVASQNPQIEAWGQALKTAGTPLTLIPFPGFEALFEDTSRNRTPDALFSTVIDWVKDHFDTPLTTTTEAAAQAADLMPLQAYETPVSFGSGLRGLLCTPQTPDEQHKGRVVVFCNTSGEPRSGIGGFSTTMSRALAQSGLAALRFDFGGMGDSDRPDLESLHVYETPRKADLEQAVAFLQTRGFDKVVLAGVCSGGYHAINQGPMLSGIEALISINTLKFIWQGEEAQPDLGRSSQSYLKLAMTPATWGRLLKNNIDVATIATTIARRLKTRYLSKSARSEEDILRGKVLDFLKQGGRTLMITGTEDASLDALESVFGAGGKSLTQQGGEVVIDPDIDHGLALRSSRRRVTDYLLAFTARL